MKKDDCKTPLSEVVHFSNIERKVLLTLSIIGLVGPNGIFVYYSLFRWSDFLSTLRDPVALSFIVEAFLVMGILAWCCAKLLSPRQGWLFVLFSLIGGLGFSLPVFLFKEASHR